MAIIRINIYIFYIKYIICASYYEEDYYDQLGMERFIGLSDEEKAEALKIVDKDKAKYKTNIKKAIEKVDKYIDSEIRSDLGSKYNFRKSYDSKEELNDKIETFVDTACDKLKGHGAFGNTKSKVTIPLFQFDGISKCKRIVSDLTLIFKIPIIGLIILVSDKSWQNSKRIESNVKHNEDINNIFGTKLIVRTMKGKKRERCTVSLQIKLNLKNIWKAGGLEDFTESAIIEDEMNKFLNM